MSQTNTFKKTKLLAKLSENTEFVLSSAKFSFFFFLSQCRKIEIKWMNLKIKRVKIIWFKYMIEISFVVLADLD